MTLMIVFIFTIIKRSNQMDDSFDPESKCLEVAEKIIGCLNEGAILKRFQEIKRNIIAQSQSMPDIQSHLKAVVLENREISKKLEELKSKIDSNTNLSDYSLSILNDYIAKTCPNPRPPETSIDEAISDLMDILDAREKASSVKRKQFTDENAALRDKISKIEAVTNEEIKRLRQRMLENDHKSRQNQKQLQTQISRIRAKVEQQSIKLDDLIEENQEIEKSMHEKKNIAESLMTKLQEAERRHGIDQKQLENLHFQLQRAENLVKAKEREIQAKRATQRFGIGDANEADLETIRNLEEEIASLYQENQELSLELKKKKLMPGGILFSDSNML